MYIVFAMTDTDNDKDRFRPCALAWRVCDICFVSCLQLLLSLLRKPYIRYGTPILQVNYNALVKIISKSPRMQSATWIAKSTTLLSPSNFQGYFRKLWKIIPMNFFSLIHILINFARRTKRRGGKRGSCNLRVLHEFSSWKVEFTNVLSRLAKRSKFRRPFICLVCALQPLLRLFCIVANEYFALFHDSECE